jgi:hypothetical protein
MEHYAGRLRIIWGAPDRNGMSSEELILEDFDTGKKLTTVLSVSIMIDPFQTMIAHLTMLVDERRNPSSHALPDPHREGRPLVDTFRWVIVDMKVRDEY